METKNYWIISQLFYPDETSTGFVMTRIAEKLASKNNVRVICGGDNYQSRALTTSKSIDERVKICRIKMPSLNKNNLFLRLLSFIILTFGVSLNILFKVKRKDVVILVTDPPILILSISLLKWFKKFKLYVIIHDVFPENLVVTGMIRPSSILYKIVRKFFNVSFNSADKLIACGDDMKEIFQKKVKENVPVSVITNWADNLEVFPTRQPDLAGYYKLEDIKNKITLQFAGNIGRVQGLDRFLKLFLQIENKNVFLVIIGDGAFKSRLLELMISHHTENVLFLPSKPRSEQNTFLNACDIGLVTLSPGMYGLGVPSKVYNILSAGKPVLYIGDYNSEIYRYINLYNVGWAFNWEDSTRITQFLNSLGPKKLPDLLERGNAARLLVEKKFTRDSILKQFEAVLQ